MNSPSVLLTHQPRRNRTLRALLFVMLLCIIAAFAATQLQRPILDWMSLQGYAAPAAVASLASADTMTPRATRMFYVNHPTIDTKAVFVQNCNFGSEQSIVIGCYHSNQAGIHLLDVTDPRLNGVEQVTAAHEMLHAGYDRLSVKDRARMDKLLQDFYNRHVTDARVRATIDQYRKTEPNDVVNEMHSIFGTEIAQLTPELETYYAQYFSDRAKVVGYAAAYSSEFTSRQQQVAAYDVELTQIKSTITENTKSLDEERANLQELRAKMDSERSNDPQQYNRDVGTYNVRVAAYNTKLVTTRSLIDQYNDIVDKRNTIALEEKQLAQAISGNSVPASQ